MNNQISIMYFMIMYTMYHMHIYNFVIPNVKNN